MRKNTTEKIGNSKSLKERLGLDKLKVAAAIGAAAVTAAALVGVAGSEAHNEVPATHQAVTSQELDLAAITKIITGGNGDPGSGLFLQALANQGMINWNENNYLVAYPADVAQGEASANVARETAQNEYWAAHERGDQTIMVAFSLGNIPMAQAVTNIANANGGRLPDDLTVVAYGSPNGESGFFNSSYGRVSEPFINIAGISTDQTLPGGDRVYDVASQNDFWARTGQDTWLGQIAKATAIPQGHRVPAPNEPHIDWVGNDGVHYSSYDVGVHPWTMVLSANGMYVNDGYNEFFNGIVPVSNGRDPAPNPDARKAIDGLAKAFDEQAGSGQTFQILFKFIPAFPFQVGLDLGTKVPDAVVHAAEAGVQGVAYGPQAAADSLINAPASLSSPQVKEQQAQVDNLLSGEFLTSNPVSEALQNAVNQATEGFGQVTGSNVAAAEAPAPAPAVVPETVNDAVSQPQDIVNDVVEQATNALNDVVEQVQAAVPAVELPAPAPAPVFQAPAPAPVVEAPAPEPAPVYEAPAPEPVYEAPAPAPAPAPVYEAPAPVFQAPAPVEVPAPVQQVVDQAQNMVNDVLGGFMPAPAQ